VGMESDIHGTVSNVLLQKASFDTAPAWLADLTVRHPTNDNGVLLWHSDAPLSLCHPAVRPRMGTHWILPSPLSGMSHFRLRDGGITVARFDGDRGNYRLAVGEGRSIEGPYTQNNYVWMEVDDWPRWERKFLHGPFIHHVAMSYGRAAAALKEACRYVPGLEVEALDAEGA
jgi:L-fucose isomerase-like protein